MKAFLLTLIPCKHQFQMSSSFSNTIPTGLASVRGFFLCSAQLLPAPLHCTRTRVQTRVLYWQDISLIDLPAFLHVEDNVLHELPTWMSSFFLQSWSPEISPLPISRIILKVCSRCLSHPSQNSEKYFQYYRHKSWCFHCLFQDSVQCTIQNWSNRQELIISQFLLLE